MISDIIIDIRTTTLEPVDVRPRVGDYIEPGVRIVTIWDDSYTTAYDEPEEQAANVAAGAQRYY
jgi:hypothetical protein